MFGHVRRKPTVWGQSSNGEANQSLSKLVESEQEELQGATDRRIGQYGESLTMQRHRLIEFRAGYTREEKLMQVPLDVDNCSIFSLFFVTPKSLS